MKKIGLMIVTFLASLSSRADVPLFSKMDGSKGVGMGGEGQSRQITAEEALSVAVDKGAVVIQDGSSALITEELQRILIQISRSQARYDRPVLIIKNGSIVVNDSDKLNKALMLAGQTMTSV